MGNLFKLEKDTTRKNKSTAANRIIAKPSVDPVTATVLRSIETRPQSLPRNSTRTVTQVNVKNTLPTLSKTTGLIDVINNFDWTTTPSRAGSAQDFKLPSVRVEEFEMSRTSVVNAIRYQLQAFGDALDDNADSFKRIVDSLSKVELTTKSTDTTSTGSNAGAAVGKFLQVFASTTGKALQELDLPNTLQSVSNFTGGVINSVDTILGGQPNQSKSSDWLGMLDGLYSLESTRFQYIFPYFENASLDAITRFSDVNSVLKSSMARDVAGAFTRKFGEAALGGAELSQPGVYVEQPQLMDIGSSTGADITIRFPLLNTLSYEAAVKNYQLLWLLAFQNKPYRESKTVASPAKIYRVHIPGIKYMHFAHMSNMNVEFMGVRRTVGIPMPTVSGTPNVVQVVMPDAYNVSITFKSLTTDMGNLMIEQLKRGRLS